MEWWLELPLAPFCSSSAIVSLSDSRIRRRRPRLNTSLHSYSPFVPLRGILKAAAGRGRRLRLRHRSSMHYGARRKGGYEAPKPIGETKRSLDCSLLAAAATTVDFIVRSSVILILENYGRSVSKRDRASENLVIRVNT